MNDERRKPFLNYGLREKLPYIESEKKESPAWDTHTPYIYKHENNSFLSLSEYITYIDCEGQRNTFLEKLECFVSGFLKTLTTYFAKGVIEMR